MTVRVRLQRFGRRNRPFYRVVVADSRAPRDGKFIELVGTYNPLATRSGVKEVTFKVDRIRYWVSVGAQPSDRVAWLLGQFGILPPKVVPVARNRKILPRKERKELKKQQGLHTSASARLADLQPSACYADSGGPAGAALSPATLGAMVDGGVVSGHQVPETRRQPPDGGVRFDSPLSFGWASGKAAARIGGSSDYSSSSSSSRSASASSTNPAQVDHGAAAGGGSSLAARLSQMSLSAGHDDTAGEEQQQRQQARSNGGGASDAPPLSTFSPLHAVLASHLSLLGPAACSAVGLRAGGAEGPRMGSKR